MPTKLYVTNLSRSATLTSLRQFFGACGEVVEVEFLAERDSRPTSTAYVTMASPAAAALAVNKLHSRLLHDRSVMVSLAPGATGTEREGRAKAPAPPGVRMAQQYRDRHAMFYELDCSGLQLKLRFVFPEQQDQAWCVQAIADRDEASVVEASAPTRALAFEAVVKACELLAAPPWLPVRWPEVTEVLKTVRAI